MHAWAVSVPSQFLSVNYLFFFNLRDFPINFPNGNVGRQIVLGLEAIEGLSSED